MNWKESDTDRKKLETKQNKKRIKTYKNKKENKTFASKLKCKETKGKENKMKYNVKIIIILSSSKICCLSPGVE